MVGCRIRSRKIKQEAAAAEEWIGGLLRSKFFGSCVDHGEFRKNEKNLFCIDCNLCLCKHCVTSSLPPPPHHHRRLLQICKYVYRDVVRLHDIQPYLDCSLIQAYKINGEKAVHLNPRPQLKDAAKSSKTKGGGTCCEACGRHIQDLPNRFCSIACKVSLSLSLSHAYYYIFMLLMDRRLIMQVSVDAAEVMSPWSEGRNRSSEREENSFENGYGSLTESSSEVIQVWWRSDLKPKRMIHKRKGLPRRAPLS